MPGLNRLWIDGMTPETPSLIVRVSRIPKSGEDYHLKVEGDVLGLLASQFDLIEIASLEARLNVTTWGQNGARVKGVIMAEIAQQCVVSLEQMEVNLSFEVERLFAPDSEIVYANAVFEDNELILDPESDDGPDLVVDDRIDLWAMVLEELDLKIEPFPRKPGFKLTESTETGIDNGEEENPSPFADLKDRLAKKGFSES